MTDKQIIIDGVDVSWCKHYKHNDKNSGWSGCTSKDEEHIHSVNPLCCEKKDCLYKQLKAKEQECEELKIYIESNEQQVKEVETLVMDNDRLINELDQLKSENETLKQYKASKQASYEEMQRRWNEVEQENRQLKSENKHLNDLLNQALKDYDKTRETLTEIKQIAEKCCIMQAILDCENYDDCTQCGRTSDGEGIQQILQKISEVEE